MTVRKKHDGLFKTLLSIALTGRDTLEGRQQPIDGETQYADLYAEPGDVLSTDARSGMLQRMCRDQSTLLEVFRNTPESHEVRDCVGKLLTFVRRVEDAWLWILSPGQPHTAMRGVGSRSASQKWCSGFHVLPPSFRTGIVVISQLPEREDTLVLRLMGRGEVQRRAIEELLASEPDLKHDPYVRAFYAWRVALDQLPRDHLEDADEELLMNTRELVEQHYKTITHSAIEQGLEQGLEQGVRSSILNAFNARHGEAPEALKRALEGCHNIETLNGWLTLVVTTSREDSIQRILG